MVTCTWTVPKRVLTDAPSYVAAVVLSALLPLAPVLPFAAEPPADMLLLRLVVVDVVVSAT
jgi:hypothetical protein